jgi:HlyD family secretion protein
LVVAGAPLVTIANLGRVRIEAEAPEADSAPVRVGLRALITADGLPGASWRGVVEETPASVVQRKLKPEDTVRPIQERVLIVMIALSQPVPIKLNSRVDVALIDDARHGRFSPSLR